VKERQLLDPIELFSDGDPEAPTDVTPGKEALPADDDDLALAFASASRSVAARFSKGEPKAPTDVTPGEEALPDDDLALAFASASRSVAARFSDGKPEAHTDVTPGEEGFPDDDLALAFARASRSMAARFSEAVDDDATVVGAGAGVDDVAPKAGAAATVVTPGDVALADPPDRALALASASRSIAARFSAGEGGE
jgi:hypothetical protein